MMELGKTLRSAREAKGLTVGQLSQGQELVLFVTEVTAGYDTSWFVENFGCEAYFRHNRELLFDTTRSRIQREIAAARSGEREDI